MFCFLMCQNKSPLSFFTNLFQIHKLYSLQVSYISRMLSFLNCEKSHFNALWVSLSPPPRHPTFIPPYALIISWSMSNPDIQHYILNIFNSSYRKFCFSEVSTSRQEHITSLMAYTNCFQWSSFTWVDSVKWELHFRMTCSVLKVWALWEIYLLKY